MNGSQRPVQSGYGTAVFPRQLHKVSVSDLPMPHDSRGWHVEIGNIVRPEFVPREGKNGFEQELCGFGSGFGEGRPQPSSSSALTSCYVEGGSHNRTLAREHSVFWTARPFCRRQGSRDVRTPRYAGLAKL